MAFVLGVTSHLVHQIHAFVADTNRVGSISFHPAHIVCLTSSATNVSSITLPAALFDEYHFGGSVSTIGIDFEELVLDMGPEVHRVTISGDADGYYDIIYYDVYGMNLYVCLCTCVCVYIYMRVCV